MTQSLPLKSRAHYLGMNKNEDFASTSFIDPPVDDDEDEQPVILGDEEMTEEKFIELNFKNPEFNNATNAFGRINFLGHSQSTYAPYVRISHNDKAEQVVELMKRFWSLDGKDLKLVLSVTGGAQDFKLSPIQQEAIKKGIMSIATESHGWITCGGTDAGIMRICGEAVAEYRELHLDDKFVLIGIVTWGIINNKEMLVRKEHTRSQVPYYCTEKKFGPGLDPNHTHFILVDDGTERKYGGEITMRTSIEEQIVKKFNCQCVCLVVEGGPGTALTALGSLKKNIPIVVLEGSGRFADALAFAYKRTLNKRGSVDLESLLPDKLSNWCRNKEGVEQCCKAIIECLQHSDKIFIEKLEPYNSVGIHKTIMRAFVKGYYNTNSEQQLEVSLNLNQLEIANDIFMTHPQFRTVLLKRLLVKAIQSGQTNFIELLTENGILLSDLREDDVNDFRQIISQRRRNFLKCVRNMNPREKVEATILLYLTLNKDISSLLVTLKQMNQPISKCLYVCEICTKMQRESSEQTQIDKIKKVFDRFENLSISIINQCWSIEESPTMDILSVESSFGKTVIEHGLNSNAKKFMASEAVQRLFSSLWHGNIPNKTGLFRLVITLIFPFLLLCNFIKFEKKSNLKKAIHNFYTSPIVKCLLAIFFGIIFAFGFSIFLISYYDFQRITFFEWAILVTVFAFLVEEIRQCIISSISAYINDTWNIIDLTGIISFFIGFIARLLSIHTNFLFDYKEHLSEIGVFCYVLSLLSYYIRLMQACYFIPQLGPKITMIRKMLADLFFFLFILSVFLLGCGVTEYVVLNITLENSNMQKNHSLIDMANIIFFNPYFRLYGETFLDDLMTNEFRRNVDIFIVVLYMILTNVVLLNMLIAMFGYTFSTVQNNADLYWKFQRFFFLYEYRRCPPLPGPLMLLYQPYYFVSMCYGNQRSNDKIAFRKVTPGRKKMLIKFENERFKEVMWKHHLDEMNSTESKLFEMQSKINKLGSNLDTRMQFIEDQLCSIAHRINETSSL